MLIFVKKIVASVLIITLLLTTAVFAKYEELLSTLKNDSEGQKFLSKIYSVSSGKTPKQIDSLIIKFVTECLDLCISEVDKKIINESNYKEKIQANAKLLLGLGGDNIELSRLIASAYDVSLDSNNNVIIPNELKPVISILENKIVEILGIKPINPPTNGNNPPNPDNNTTPPNDNTNPTKPPTTTGGSIGGGGGSFTNPPQQSTNKFSDLSNFKWAEEAVLSLSASGVISGVSQNEFAPQNLVKREEFVKMVAVAFELLNDNATSTFKDVDNSKWYYKYVSSMYQKGLSKGYENGNFGIGENITRQDMAVFLFRITKLLDLEIGTQSSISNFADDNKISSYAKEAVYFMKKGEIISGKSGNNFDPQSFATRAEAAVLIHRLHKTFILNKLFKEALGG